MGNVAEIYDQLFHFESKKRSDSYPIHKKLQLEHHADLVHWLIDNVDFKATDHVWDAGCGVGYSLLTLAPLIEHGYGCSLSKSEIDFAIERARKKGYGSKLHFDQSSFEFPRTKKFNKIVMIESLKHTSNLDKTLSSIIDSLSPHGQLIIADDFSLSENRISADHRELWNVPSFSSSENLIDLINTKGQFSFDVTDFTNKVPIRNGVKLKVSIGMIRTILTLGIGQSQNLKTYLGGLLLEQLYNKGQANYKVICCRKLN